MDYSMVDFNNCVFRYRTCEQKNYDALTENKLYFSIPAKFNDPYDCLLFANIQKIWAEVNANVLSEMDSYIEKIRENNPLEACITYKMWNFEREKALDLLFDNIHNNLKYFKRLILENTRVICFSEKYDSALMWSHYANYHEGFVIVYDKDKLINSPVFSASDQELLNRIRIDPIKYSEKQLDLTNDLGWIVRENWSPKKINHARIENYIGSSVLRQALLQKSTDWSYEKEWRITERKLNIQEPSNISYLKCKPEAILVGSKCTKENHANLARIAIKLGVPIYRLYLSETVNSFELRIGDGESYHVF